jgi:hypothetical protein
MNHIIEKPPTIIKPVEPEQEPKRPHFFWVVLILFLILFAFWKGVDFLIIDDDGAVQLAPERQDELDRRLKNLQKAEQYVLIARYGGVYPCFNCGTASTIRLLKGEIWKYGTTLQNGRSRYSSSWLGKSNLVYITEYEGTPVECLELEALKIYKYAILPENTKRAKPIIRPPGNKVDN